MSKNKIIFENGKAVDYWFDYQVYPRLEYNFWFRNLWRPLIKCLFKQFLVVFSKILIDRSWYNELRISISEKIKKDAGDIKFLIKDGWKKRLAFIFTGDDSYPSYVWKMAAEDKTKSRLITEDNIIGEIKQVSPFLSKTIPDIITREDTGDDLSILERTIGGYPLLKDLYVNRNSIEAVDRIFSDVTGWLKNLHKDSKKVKNAGVLSSYYDGGDDEYSIQFYINRLMVDQGEKDRISGILKEEIEKINECSMPFVIQHGDFQPENIFYDTTNNMISVIDWEYSKSSSLPAVDLLNFFFTGGGFVMKTREIGMKNILPWQRLSSLRFMIDVKTYKYIYCENNDISMMIKKHIESYCINIGVEKSVLRVLFFIYLLKNFPHDKMYLQDFLNGQNSIVCI
ncbi:phosphotransferase [Elusimicrobiota bacterium]